MRTVRDPCSSTSARACELPHDSPAASEGQRRVRIHKLTRQERWPPRPPRRPATARPSPPRSAPRADRRGSDHAAAPPGVAPIRKRPSGPLVVRFYRSAVGKKWVMAVTGVILMRLRGRAPHRQPQAVPLEGGDQPLRRGAAQHARRTVAAHRVAVDDPHRLDPRVRLPHPFRGRAHAHQPQGPPGRRPVPVEARLRRRRLRVAHDALDRRVRAAVPRLPPDGPHVGQRELRSSCAAIRTTTWCTACNARRSRSSTPSPAIALAIHLYHGAWSMFQSLGITNPRYNSLRRRFAQGLRRRSCSSAT